MRAFVRTQFVATLIAFCSAITPTCLQASTTETLAFQAQGKHSAGVHTFFGKPNRNSFLQPSPGLDFEQGLNYRVGQAVFEKIWVFAPSSTTASDGLGPLYNARSCHRCHLRNGRGQESNLVDGQSEIKSPVSLFLRLSVPPANDQERALLKQGQLGFIPEPTYGSQLQTFAYPGGKYEGRLIVRYTASELRLDGQEVTLYKPNYEIEDLGYGAMHESVMLSPRIAPPMIGMGLIDAIDENDILALADPEDLNNDGISGQPNWVWNRAKERQALGRFGWKAGTPTLSQQNANALNGDIGISSRLFPYSAGDCTAKQVACLNQAHGAQTDRHDGFEAADKLVYMMLHFTRYIAVPARRNVDDHNVVRGEKHFHNAGCANCHKPSFVTSEHSETEGMHNQKIWPYSDFLLHDMGEALADHRPEFKASGREWRTPPLWGIGLTRLVGGGEFYLHDGRARSLLEAILWHGGEAQSAKQHVVGMNQLERNQLIRFLESL